MRKAIIIGFVLMLMGQLQLAAQHLPSFQEVDRLTFAYYQTAQWDSLIEKGKWAELAQIDYYYLNYRMAIAYYNKRNYFTASHYFYKAFKQNNAALQDAYFKEIYYRSLQYSNQTATAGGLLSVADSLADNEPRYYAGKVYLSYVNGNISHSVPIQKLRTKPASSYGEAHYQQSIRLWDFGISYLMNEHWEMDFHLSNANLGMISAVENPEVFHIRNYEVNQLALNFKSRFLFTPIKSLSLFFGYSNVNGKPYGRLDSNELNLGYSNYKSKSIMLAVDYQKRYKKTLLGFNAAYSDFSDDKQAQLGLSLDWFPKGNLNFYTSTHTYGFASNAFKQYRPIVYQKVGFKLSSHLWMEVQGIFGDVQNFTLLNDNYSFEIPDHTFGLAGVQLLYLLGERIHLSLGSQYYWKYTEMEENELINRNNIQRIPYQQINLLGGLQWKF